MTMPHEPDQAQSASVLAAGLGGRCPRCLKSSLYASPLSLRVREACPACNLDLRFVDPGDGPAVFAIMLLGFLVLGGALILEFKIGPPLWLHVLLWGPVSLGFGFVLLRVLKALLVAQQLKHKAAEAGAANLKE
jgi:uncharacterized protein (DUF983 family)